MIKLSSAELRVKKILKPTQAMFFKDIKEGDHIGISHTLKDTTGASGGGSYASYLTIINYTRNTKKGEYSNNLVKRLSNFEIEEIQ